MILQRYVSRSIHALIASMFAAAPPTPASAEQARPSPWTVTAIDSIDVFANLTYLTAAGVENKLDIYTPVGDTPSPAVLHFHPGGWRGLSKDSELPMLFPFLELGWAVVNVEYRINAQSLAPGAVEDARCAVRWIIGNAATYRIDASRIILSGRSSGGHLALMAGMADTKSGFDYRCNTLGPDDFKVAGVINWFGITDVAELITPGKSYQRFAAAWIGTHGDPVARARRVSPMNYVSRDDPPVITIHGSMDALVPYSQAVRLHRLLEKQGVRNRLHTVRDGGHAGFTRAQTSDAYAAIMDFMRAIGVLK